MKMVKIDLLSDEETEAYEQFVLQSPQSLIYASDLYRRLLQSFLKAKASYLIAHDARGEIVGALPAFLCMSEYGCVLNSLPFYGSHGGVIEYHGNTSVRQALLEAFLKLAEERHCISATVISVPFERDLFLYKDILHYDCSDERIGQITRLYENAERGEKQLWMRFHYKTRNAIRKAEKIGITISSQQNKEAFSFLYHCHVINMEKIGGKKKPEVFFSKLSEIFVYKRDYRIYTAFWNGKPIAALLLLYYNRTVEYFTPVIEEEYRSFQPLSLIIYRAMLEALEEGYQYWNWGGTWYSQRGVYDFKKRWGTEEFPYHYFINVFQSKLYEAEANDLERMFPFFYTIPYGRIRK